MKTKLRLLSNFRRNATLCMFHYFGLCMVMPFAESQHILVRYWKLLWWILKVHDKNQEKKWYKAGKNKKQLPSGWKRFVGLRKLLQHIKHDWAIEKSPKMTTLKRKNHGCSDGYPSIQVIALQLCQERVNEKHLGSIF